MAPLDDTTARTRFDSFDVYRTWYKMIGTHEIEVGILVPKGLASGKKYPVHVKFHGGGLVTGSALYPDWFAAWFVPLTHRAQAITVLPNYRLMPEHNGREILLDLTDFWTWFHAGGVDRFLASPAVKKQAREELQLDYTRLFVSGESAGGYMALQSGLTRPKGEIKVILAQYPMTNFLNRKPMDLFYGQPAPQPSVLEAHLKSIKPGTVISSCTPPARTAISYCLSAYRRYVEFFGTGKELWPISAVEDATYVPPTIIFHGVQDTAVSIEDSRAFVAKVKKRLPGAEVRLVERDGDHGFDMQLKEDEEAYLKEGLGWVEERW